MAASKNGHTATVRLLLLAEGVRSSLDATDAHGRSALLYAVLGSHAGAAKVLVSAGADASLADGGGGSPLSVAMEHRDEMMLTALGVVPRKLAAQGSGALF